MNDKKCRGLCCKKSLDWVICHHKVEETLLPINLILTTTKRWQDDKMSDRNIFWLHVFASLIHISIQNRIHSIWCISNRFNDVIVIEIFFFVFGYCWKYCQRSSVLWYMSLVCDDIRVSRQFKTSRFVIHYWQSNSKYASSRIDMQCTLQYAFPIYCYPLFAVADTRAPGDTSVGQHFS